MFVPCPHCGFLVALIVGEDVGAQDCPRCGKTLGDEGGEAPAQDDASTAEAAPAAPPVTPGGPSATRAVNDMHASAGTRRRREARPATPAFARRRAPGERPRRRWVSWLVMAGLALLLALQLFLSQYRDLAADAGSRPLAATVCGVLGCTLPPWREPTAWTMLSRDVVPSRSQPGVLEVTAAFRNDADWPQPLPVLALALTDRHGQVVVARAFRPDEYRTDGSPHTLGSGEATQAAFRVREPDADIVAFSFEFR